MSKQRRAALVRDLESAESYASWRTIALELDGLEGADDWKQDENSTDFDFLLIKGRLAEMRRLRRAGDVRRLAFALVEGLHGNLGNVTNPALYAHSRVGTKRLIEHYLSEVVRCLDDVCLGDFPDFPQDSKTVFFERAAASFGRSALMLSGGATLGMFHLGTIKALWEQNLLPRVISGSSAGSIIAGMVGVRDDDRLPEIFDADSLNLRAFQRASIRGALRVGTMMDPGLLQSCLARNIGGDTFTTAFERTRRIVGVTVSPVEPLQQGRLLNYLTAPNVLMSAAIMASCAIPGVFPPVMLEARDYDDQTVPHLPSKRWNDGTLSADLPMLRLARLHNVNHYIVSQTNPHVLPFMRDRRAPRHGLLPFLVDVGRTNARHTLKLASQRLRGMPAMRMADRLGDIIGQRYSGDINIFPRQSARRLMRLLSNPSTEDIERFIRDGERATWPNIERIRHQTCISRAFEDCIDRLSRHAREPAGSRPKARADAAPALRAVN